MATDRRELILSRLVDIFAGLDGVVTVARNRTLLTAVDLPAVYLLDGDETSIIAQGAPRPPDGKPIGLSDLILMTPEIYLQLSIVKPHNQVEGALLNEWRRKLVVAVLSDESLRAYVSHPTGTIRYTNFFTSFGRGKGNDGMLQVEFQFVYPHKLSELS